MAPADMASSPSAGRVQAVLLDYFRAPGKYQLGSRQPEVLFDAIREVLQIATGRTDAVQGHDARELREAAAFFLGAALLYPGADHYALLGVGRGAEAAELKERYRLLMRLVHPDFADAARADWPKDSAMRVNRAYEVLSSPVLRREYDEQVACPPPAHRAAGHEATRPVRAAKSARIAKTKATAKSAKAPRRPWRMARGRPARVAAWSFVVLVSLLAVAMLLPRPAPVRLVQKPGPADASRTRISTTATPPANITPERSIAQTPPVTDPLPVAKIESALPALPPAAGPLVRGAEPPAAWLPVVPADPPPAKARPVDHLASVGPMTPAPAVVDALASLPAPAPAALLVPVPTPITAPTPIPVPPPGANDTLRQVATRPWKAKPPTLDDAQPLLTQLLHELESGSPEQVLRLLDPVARQSTSAQSLSRQYQRIVKGSSPVTLSHVEFRSEANEDVLVVVGHVRLQVGESTVGSIGEKFAVRAEFATRGGRVALTRLSGAAE